MKVLEAIKNQTSSTLRQGAMAKARYRLPFNTQEVTQLLWDAYCAEVRKRNADPQQTAETQTIMASIARWLIEQQAKPALILQGNVGNGKSTTARSVATLFSSLSNNAAQYLKENSWRMKKEEKMLYEHLVCAPQWVFVTAQELVDMATRQPEKYEVMKTTLHLIIDEMGLEPATAKIYGTEVTPIADVLAHRYNEMLPTIITTNLNDDAIRAKYGVRIADRLREICGRLVYRNASFR